jgi:hypothetical protein
MATGDLVSLMQREREKYIEQRDRARTELEEAERWLHKIDAFLAVEAPSAKSPEGERGTGTRTRKPREQTAKVRQDVIDAIRQNPVNGVPAKDLYGMLEPTGHKRSTINAALFQLTKEGTLTQSGRRQPYKLAAGAGAAPAATSSSGSSTSDESEEDAA